MTANKSGSKFFVSEQGYYGEFGGAFIPEILYPNIEELRLAFQQKACQFCLTFNYIFDE